MDLKGKCSCNLNSSGFELGVMPKLSFVRFGVLMAASRPACWLLLAGSLRGLHRDPDDGGNAVQRKIDEVPDCNVSHPRL
jgi:hypothetical protein